MFRRERSDETILPVDETTFYCCADILKLPLINNLPNEAAKGGE